MRSIDTLILPRWLVPIEPANVCLENYAVAIHQDKILAVLPANEAKTNYQSTQTIELKTHVVMPGLINAHTHSPMTLFRGLADDLALMNWLQNHIWPAESKWLSEQFCYDGTQLAILEMLRSGTTCFNDNYFFSDSIAQAALDSGMRACIGACIIDFPTNYAQSADDYLKKAETLYNNWHAQPLISVTLAPHAPYTVSDDTFIKILNFAEKYPMPLHLHLHETATEIAESLQEHGKRPIERVYQLGLMSERLQCIHMTQIVPSDIALLQKTGTHVVHCPESNLKLASGFCPAEALLEAGINVALGTDGAASNNDLDMFGEMRTAAIVAKVAEQDPTALTAGETLQMATLNGARALGIADKIGSLIPGKLADIIAVDLSDPNSQPVYNPISHLAYAINSRQVSDVWIAGKRLLENGEFTLLDKDAIIDKVRAWSSKIHNAR